jgi:iron complex transport system permease protein
MESSYESTLEGQYVSPEVNIHRQTTQLHHTYRRHQFRKVMALCLGMMAVLTVVIVATKTGAKDMSLAKVALAIWGRIVPWIQLESITTLEQTIVWHLRLPRVMMGLVAGAGLAVAGVVMQGVTRNPLVSPFTIGISPAAAFGASLAIIWGAMALPAGGRYVIVGAAFLSAFLCVLLVLFIASLRGISVTTIILTGIALTYLFSALTATVQFVATEEQLAAVVHWTFGTLNRATWDEVGITTLFFAICLPVFFWNAWAYNAMASGGDDTATSLGFHVKRVRVITSLLAVLLTASIVSFTGVIGFVGLVAPHITRLIIGSDHRYLLPLSCCAGAVLLLLADTIGRTLFAPAVLPVGIVVSYLGVPLFVHLIILRRKYAL